MHRRLALYRTMSSVFHAHLKPLAMLSTLTAFQLVTAVCSGLDNLVYRRWKNQKLDRPIFILGNPRSGTTFLHRLLLGAGSMSAMELWEMMLPAITARKALGQVVPRMSAINPAQYHASDAHETSLRGIETDDLAWLFHSLDGPFAWAYFSAWHDTWGTDSAQRAFAVGDVEGDDDRFFSFFEKVWKKSLYLSGKSRMLVKSSMLTFRIPAILRRYPDAKLLYVVRDPVETIPSGMSLLTDALQNAFDIDHRTTASDRNHWLDNLYRVSVALFRDFHGRYVAGEIPADSLLIVRYPDLIENLEQTMSDILEFIDVAATEEFRQEVRGQAAKQRAHNSSHTYSAERFGLTEQRIRHDLVDIYATFRLDPTSTLERAETDDAT